jgi:BASS family bile acid:Na+ symporter
MRLVSVLSLGLAISIFLTVLSLGMKAGLGDVACLFRRPGQLIRALLSMYVVMPVFAILVVKFFHLRPIIEVVLVALSVSPIPPVFPKAAFRSGGKAPFTFGLLVAISLLSIIVIPLAFVLFDVVFPRETQFSEAALLYSILTKVLLPLAIGMALRHFAPGFCERSAATIEKVRDILLLAVALPIVIFILPAIWSLIGAFTTVALVLFVLVGSASGYFLGGPDPVERSVLALATASRHPGIAITLATANMPETFKKLVIAVVILYLAVVAIVMTPFLEWLSRNQTGKRADAR